MTSQTHRIARQVIELTLPGQPSCSGQNNALAQEVSRIYHQRIVPLIEQTCNELAGPDQVLRFDTLELDLGMVEAEELESQLVSRVAASLRQQLRTASEQVAGPSRESVRQQSALELFATYVGSGSVPWWAERHNPALLGANLQQLLRDSPAALKSALPELVADPLACQRMAGQFSDAQLAQLCALCLPAAGKHLGPRMRTLLASLQRCASGRIWPPARLRLRSWCIALQLACGDAGGGNHALHAANGAELNTSAHAAGNASHPDNALGRAGPLAHFLHTVLQRLAYELACDSAELAYAVLQVLRSGKIANSAALLADLSALPALAALSRIVSASSSAAAGDTAAPLVQRLLRLQLGSSGALRDAWCQLLAQVKKQVATDADPGSPAPLSSASATRSRHDEARTRLLAALTGSPVQAAKQVLSCLPQSGAAEFRELVPVFAAALAAEGATALEDANSDNPANSSNSANSANGSDQVSASQLHQGRSGLPANPLAHHSGEAAAGNAAANGTETAAEIGAKNDTEKGTGNGAGKVSQNGAENGTGEGGGNVAGKKAQKMAEAGAAASTSADPLTPDSTAGNQTANNAANPASHGRNASSRASPGGESALAILLRRYHSRGGVLADLLAVLRDDCWHWSATIRRHWLLALAPDLANALAQAAGVADDGEAAVAEVAAQPALLAQARRVALLDPDSLAHAIAHMLQASPAQHGLSGQLRSRLLSLLRAPQRIADAGDNVPIDNAGLVLLWPFLGSFFGHLGLLEERDFKDLAARQRAVGLLQVLATPQTRFAEYALPLNKLLCNLEQAHPFEFGPRLKKREVRECNQLLEAVIAQAPILKNMSPDGFRGSFLLRKGVLSSRAGHWLLQVEAQTYDIVLDRLPWSRDWIKLPWMEAPLRVEWSI